MLRFFSGQIFATWHFKGGGTESQMAGSHYSVYVCVRTYWCNFMSLKFTKEVKREQGRTQLLDFSYFVLQYFICS